ncbi:MULTISPECIES: hypothetical protein [Sphingobium]|uniref:Uncharacterized protein n=2 Tax=Sphingobium TaxID=165695 RepID=T0GWR4_9SPHN|nr:MULTISPECIES: hypothetical protein [Sphingobium]EQB05137.1 hypothetical protein L485_03195 [Sphingobium baderi LL03]KKW89516.1 hypothetical protein YP76_25055 [Sphingobium chungbukense]KMS59043.1 hypothetical protein V475_20515 [Sphingobium baderi LL03]WRD78666.1 hypothetical protein QQ987_19940 [Sphingobium baderi]
MNDHTKDHLDFTVSKGGAGSLEDWCGSQAVRGVQSLVEQRLSQGFAELDCQTGDVEVRQQLYATLVGKAISLARQRLPDNPFLEDVLRASHFDDEVAAQAGQAGEAIPLRSPVTI